jgi:hypothetical protein
VKIVASLLLTTLFAISPKPRLQSPIESTARVMLTNFVTGRFEAATSDFNDELRPMVTPAILAQTKAQLDQLAGAFLLVKEVHQRTQEGFRAIELIARFEKSSVSVVVVFDPLDRVGAVHFNPIVSPPVDPVLEAAARGLLANFVAGRFDEAVKPFDPNMRAQLSPASLAKLAVNIAEVFGTFRSVAEVHQRIEKRYTIIDLTLSYRNAPVAFRVAFDAQNRVAALHISPFMNE